MSATAITATSDQKTIEFPKAVLTDKEIHDHIRSITAEEIESIAKVLIQHHIIDSSKFPFTGNVIMSGNSPSEPIEVDFSKDKEKSSKFMTLALPFVKNQIKQSFSNVGQFLKNGVVLKILNTHQWGATGNTLKLNLDREHSVKSCLQFSVADPIDTKDYSLKNFTEKSLP